jgi:uncharacterized RDD family membrane protein YckC
MPSITAASQPASVLFCWNCGKPLHTRAKFCSACGEKLDLGLPENTITSVHDVVADTIVAEHLETSGSAGLGLPAATASAHQSTNTQPHAAEQITKRVTSDTVSTISRNENAAAAALESDENSVDEHLVESGANGTPWLDRAIRPEAAYTFKKGNKKAIKHSSHWFFWWRIDPDELQKQVAEYKTLKSYQSARGISFWCLILSCLVTAGLIITRVFGSDAWVDCVLMMLIAAFVYRGHRWAMIAAMLLWTLEKLDLTFTSLGHGIHVWPIGQIIWWAVYMHAFYLALRVENERKRNAKAMLMKWQEANNQPNLAEQLKTSESANTPALAAAAEVYVRQSPLSVNADNVAPPPLRRRGLPVLLRGMEQDYQPPSNQINQSPIDADLRPHPWLRYWGRMTDFTIYFLLVGVVIDLICSVAKECGAFQGPIGEICIEPITERLLTIPAMIVWWLFEAFLISRFSTTFGKWLFGIRVTEPDGTKLSYKRALVRTFNMWCFGLGCLIPFATVCYQASSLFAIKRDGVAKWDRRDNTISSCIRHSKFRRVITLFFVAPAVLCYSMFILCVNSPGYMNNRLKATSPSSVGTLDGVGHTNSQ